MAEAFDPCAESPVTRHFVQDLLGSSRPFLSLIHAADDMYRYNLTSLRGSRPCAAILYYMKGWQILQTIRSVAVQRFGGLPNVESILDFASGHGRVTRFLLSDINRARICVSEIHADAVAFQRDYFGVCGLLSTPDPSKFACDRRFALVIASSFFSHVPQSSFQPWVGALLRCVDSNGALLFSVLGSELLSHEEKDWSNGIVFLPESETDRLNKGSYGTTYVTEDFVRDAILRAGKGDWTVGRFPRGLCGFQDLYVVARADTPNPVGLEPTDFPWGDVDLYEVRPDGIMSIRGWVSTRKREPVAHQVELTVNNQRVALCEAESVAPGTYRWSLDTEARRIKPDDVLMITAVSEDGMENIVALGTVRTHPPGRS